MTEQGLRQPTGQFCRRARAGPGGDRVAADHRQDIPQPAAGQGGTKASTAQSGCPRFRNPELS
jgi:hypothetical protein